MTIAQVLRPADQSRTLVYNIGLVIGGSIFIALSAQIALRIPFSPVPITGQTLAVLLVGALLGSRIGAITVTTYLAQGVMGLPVFASGLGGPAHLIGPTGGYLLGFVAAAYVVGLLAERGMTVRASTTMVSMLAGMAVIYAVGATWLAIFVGTDAAIAAGIVPFLVGDAAKISLATMILPAAQNYANRR
jgi:biotin transport system substrate-specific component